MGGPMTFRKSALYLIVVASAGVLFATALGQAQQPPAQGAAPPAGRGGGRGGGPAGALYAAVDANKDGCASRAELKATFDTWFASADTAKTGSITNEQLLT